MYYVQHRIRYGGEQVWHTVTPHGVADLDQAKQAVDLVRPGGAQARVIDQDGVVVHEPRQGDAA